MPFLLGSTTKPVTQEKIKNMIKVEQLKPTQNKLLIKPVDRPNKTKGGIYLPDTNKERPFLGLVVAVGTITEDSLDINVGDKIIFKRWEAHELKLVGDIYYIVSYNQVLAKYA